MPNWSETLAEIQEEFTKAKEELEAQIAAQGGNFNNFGQATNQLFGKAIDNVRHKYIQQVSEITGRNVIAYYSGWLHRGHAKAQIMDSDKAGFMLAIHKLDKTKGLDLILHTPGGDLAATESIVDYLHSIFGTDIRAVIPQISMSAGTMIALSCSEIIMGKHSNLGPIDPQMGGLPCQAVLSEFKQAIEEIKSNPSSAVLWQAIYGKLNPTFLTGCAQAIKWSEELATKWLKQNMFHDNDGKAISVIKDFSDHQETKSHSRHISIDRCKELGLKISDLESDKKLQDAVLTAHHCFMHTFSMSAAIKIVENQNGQKLIEQAPIPQQNMPFPIAQQGQF